MEDWNFPITLDKDCYVTYTCHKFAPFNECVNSIRRDWKRSEKGIVFQTKQVG